MTTVTTQWLSSYTQTSSQTGNYYVVVSSSTGSATEGEPVAFTVTVGNGAGTPVSGTGVTVSDNSANVVLSAGSLVTNTQGQAFFTATDNAAETVTFTVTPTAGGSPQTATVTWTVPYTPAYPSVSVPSLQISATTTTAAVGQPVVYEVTASSGYTLPPSTPIVVASSSATAQPSSTLLTTNTAGQAFFTVTDSVAETVMFTARLSSNAAVEGTCSTQWLNSYSQPNNLSSNAPIYLLTMQPSPATAAAGQPVVLNLTVLDNNGHLAPGIGVSIISSSADAQLSSTYVTTNSQGQAYVTVTDPAAETVTFTGSLANVSSRFPYVTTSVTWSSQANGSTEYTNGRVAVSGFYAALSESATSARAGQPVILTVTVTNSNNQAVPGIGVLVSASSANVQLTDTNSVTNSQGQIFVTAQDNTAENVTFSVQLETNGTYSTPVVVGSFQWY